MFNSFFKTNKINISNTKVEVGLVKDRPVLLYSIPSSYVYLDALCSICDGLEYKRIGSVDVDGISDLLDQYMFTLNGQFFCELYINAYHEDNQFVIPTPFKHLDTSVDESIFNLSHSGYYRYLRSIAYMVLTKKGVLTHEEEIWSIREQYVLNKLMIDLGYEDELEKLIFDEYVEMKNHYDALQKNEFVDIFVSKFHNINLVRYTPSFISNRNNQLLNSYSSIIETINRIQAWLDNDTLRRRVEINVLGYRSDLFEFSEMKQCVTPFCFISLGCDVFGRFNLTYGIDSRILDMVSSDMASTLIRRIYEFTSGELEPFVRFISLNMDCITYFENFVKNIDNENCVLIEVKRNKEKSIHDMFNNLELENDIDKETKKWFRR